MRLVDLRDIAAPADRVFSAAAAVTRWPEWLGHYRWVTLLKALPDHDIVEMAAWRPFGLVKYPTWWVSEMRRDPVRREVHYRHIRGITRGMEVVWQIESRPGGGSRAVIVHEWDGPAWPLIGGVAARWIIGPLFIHAIAARTLAGLARALEAGDA